MKCRFKIENIFFLILRINTVGSAPKAHPPLAETPTGHPMKCRFEIENIFCF